MTNRIKTNAYNCAHTTKANCGHGLCKSCYFQYWSLTHRGSESIRKTNLKYLYKLTPSEYERMLKRQNNKCAICESIFPGKKGSFHVDHNHVTKKVRGLLCHKCNVGIGCLRDNIAILKQAISYLLSYEKENN